MAKIAGVTTQKNAKGEITHITINMKKHGAALEPILKEMGLMEKSQFDKECEQGMTVEEARQLTLKHIKQTWKKS